MSMRSLIPIVALILLAGCGPANDASRANQANGAARPLPEVAVITVQQGAADISREFTGRLEAWRRAEVRARVAGIVKKRLFTEGAEISAGSALFQIEADTYRAALESARTEAEVAHLAMARSRELLEKKLAAPEVLDEARARYQEAVARLARARQDLDNTRVPAPISGRIGRALITEGALVGLGEPTLLAVIEQTDPIYADFTRTETELMQTTSALQSGRLMAAADTEIALLLADGSLYPYPGTILFTDSRVDPATGAVLVRSRFPNPHHTLLPGTFVRIRMPVARLPDVMRIPQRAVLAGDDGLQVLALTPDGKVVAKYIESAGMEGPDFLVRAGLRAGDQVIVEGLQKARPGNFVKAVPWQAPAAEPSTAR